MEVKWEFGYGGEVGVGYGGEVGVGYGGEKRRIIYEPNLFKLSCHAHTM